MRHSLVRMAGRVAAPLLVLILGLWSAATPGAVTAASGATPATTWTVTLTADYTNVPQGMSVVLTAQANQNVSSIGDYLAILGPGNTVIRSIVGGTTAAIAVTSATQATKGYIAVVCHNPDGSNRAAVSSTVTVTWGPAWAVTLDAVLDDGSNLNLAGGAVVQGKSVNLIAAANYDLDGYNLKVLDSSDAVVPGWATSATPASKTYHAVVRYGSDPTPLASSDPLTVTWTPAFTVTLTSNAVHGTATAGSSVTLTATANQDVGTTIYDIVILDNLNLPIGHCAFGKTCTATPWTQKAGAFTYHAMVAVMSYLNTEQVAISHPYLTVTYTPGAATQFGVVTANPYVAGGSHSVTVTALDKYGNVVTGYTGPVGFTSTDPLAILPGNYTFVAADNGVHKVTGLKLETAGLQTVTVNSLPVARGYIKGSEQVNVTPLAATHFSVATVNPYVAGASHSVTVTALDKFGNVATGYTGTIHFTSTDGKAILPVDFTFLETDNGVAKPTLKLETAGTQTVTVTDTATASITGSQAVTVTPGAATQLQVKTANPYVGGVNHTVTVTALDKFGNIATGYLGTIHFTSSDTAAVLPGDYTFIAADAGTRKLIIQLVTPGSQTVTVTDTVTATIKGSQTVSVS